MQQCSTMFLVFLPHCGEPGGCAAAVFGSIRIILEWCLLGPSSEEVAAAMPQQPAVEAPPAVVVHAVAGQQPQQIQQIAALPHVLCGALFCVVRFAVLVLFEVWWYIMVVLGLLLGSHWYVFKCTRGANWYYGAMFHLWPFGTLVALTVPHVDAVRALLAAVVAGLGICGTLYDKCENHRGDHLNVLSWCCVGAGVKLVADFLQSVSELIFEAVIHASVGLWVVYLAKHGNLPI